MTRVLKEKYRKIQKPIIKKARKITKIIKPKKIGRWCSYYENRLPYPVECANNKSNPVSTIFKDGKPRITRNYPNCVCCKRNPTFYSWKKGDWDLIIQAIADGEDLSNHPAPGREE